MPTREFLEDKQQVTLYPTKAQHKKLKELAAKRGKNLSAYILDSAFRDEKIHEKLDRIMGMLESDVEKILPAQIAMNKKIDDTLEPKKEKVKETPTFFKK